MEISLCMIVKNEEDVLERCLKSVCDLVDEIIIVDTGSTDATKEIAKKFTDKIYDFEWVDDFSAARNYSFSFATKEYSMWLDADDVITDEDAQKIRELKEGVESDVDVVLLKYNIAFDAEGRPAFFYYRERIVKTARRFLWKDPIHEVLNAYGKRLYSDAAITHKKEKPESPLRNLKIYEGMIKNNVKFSARQKFYYSRELMYNGMYEEAVDSFVDYLQNCSGWVENKIEACLNLSQCYQQLSDMASAYKVLFDSFVFDVPRAEILCELGSVFMFEEKYASAVYWYNLAAKCKVEENALKFVRAECYDIVPNLQMCVCYYRLGNIAKARYYHKKCFKSHPNHPSVKANHQFFTRQAP